MDNRLAVAAAWLGLAGMLFVGCARSEQAERPPESALEWREEGGDRVRERSSRPSEPAVELPKESGEAAATRPESESAAVDDLTPLLEPFDAPPLSEIEAQVKWIDMPVRDGLVMLRQRQQGQTPLVTVAEALRMRNDSDEANRKILSALGRLPDDDVQVNWDAAITRHIGGDIKSTNPIMISSVAEFDIAGLTNFGMFTFDWNMEPFAASDSVRSWQTSEDRMYDKIVLRDDLVWSDGKPITAHDVVFSFQTILNPSVPVPAVRSGTDQLRWVHAYDDYTVVFFHKEATATNVWNVNFPIIPRHVFEKSVEEDPTLQTSRYHVEIENNPVIGGPYKIVKRERGQEIVLQRRDEYFMHQGKQVRAKPYFKTIRFRVMPDSNTSLLSLKSGEIDEMVLTPEQWTTQTGGSDFYRVNTKAKGLEWVYFAFAWNTTRPYFDDKRVRQAMSYAFDHDEMLNTLCYGLYEPCNGIFHHTAWMAPRDPPRPYKQDLDKAEELLDEAGWIDHDGDGIRDKLIDGRRRRFEFSILCNNDPLRVQICSLLKESLDRIGVVCRVRPMEFTVLQQANLDGNFDATLLGWGTGTDPDTSENLWKTGEARNYTRYSNPEVDRLFKQGKLEFDRQKRAEIYGRIHQILYEDQPYTWLYFRSSFYGFNKQLRGYNFSPRGPYNYSPGFSAIWRAAQSP